MRAGAGAGAGAGFRICVGGRGCGWCSIRQRRWSAAHAIVAAAAAAAAAASHATADAWHGMRRARAALRTCLGPVRVRRERGRRGSFCVLSTRPGGACATARQSSRGGGTHATAHDSGGRVRPGDHSRHSPQHIPQPRGAGILAGRATAAAAARAWPVHVARLCCERCTVCVRMEARGGRWRLAWKHEVGWQVLAAPRV